MIEIKNISKTYKSKKSIDTNALKNINIKFDNKGLVFIVGKSGSGKSTLLNLIGSLDKVDSGEILVDGINICKLSNKQLDSYRNSYVGFVFQEFNLLDEFNVYENINLSLKLQNINDDKLIKNTLKLVDLESLGQRNINELSGGQKQRVSIARTLVKKPKLILADEPTGNLDSKSSKKIFDILKEISKNELVIVVSHDMESAKEYADRIIKIEDGEIIEDTRPSKNNQKDKTNFIKSNLPFSYMLKMASSYLTNKPGRLVLTILLSMVAFSFMCFCINIYLFKDSSLISNTIYDNKFNTLKIEHKQLEIKSYNTRDEKTLQFSNENIKYIENITNQKANKEYTLYENNNILTFTFDKLKETLEENEAYNSKPTNFKFIELKDNRIINLYNGNYPNDNEIVIHKYFADSIINYGILDYDNNIYRPNNYEEIINDKRKIKLGSHYVIISGIVNDDNTKYVRAFKSGDFWSNDLRRYYIDNYSSKASLIYVNNTFIDNLILEKNLDLNMLSLEYNSNTNNDKIELLSNKINYYDINGNNKQIDKLNKNEVILSIDTFRLFSTYNNHFDKYLRDNSKLVYDKIVENYLIKYLKENNNYNLNINLINKTFQNKDSLKLIGVTLDNKNYISNEYNNYYDLSKKVISSIYIYEDNKNNIENIFDKLDYSYDNEYYDEGEKYYIKFDNSNTIYGIIFIYHKAKNFLLSFSIVFTLFSLLLILNYVSSSITTYKKEIGILKSIGTNSSDVTKIFSLETLMIGLISWIFGLIIWIIEIRELNNSFFGNAYFNLKGIVIEPIVILISLLFIICSSLLITSLIMEKINKVRPIDVILNKD